jgi:hypothetical protein
MKSDVIERIKKLLRLAQSANEHESRLALERAFEIAARHQVDVAGLELDEETERVIHEWFRVGFRITLLQRRVLGIVQAFFNVSLCRSAERIVFVGTGTDIAIAWYVYEFLVGEGKRHLSIFIDTQRAIGLRSTKRKREAFIQGFVYGVSTQLQKRRDQILVEDSKFAIVLAGQEQAREEHLTEVVPRRQAEVRKLKSVNVDALMQGFLQGKQTEIRQPLKPAGQLFLT